MGIPIEAEMREALSGVEGAITSLREVLSSVEAKLGPTTWQGPAADAWVEEWHGMRSTVIGLLDRAEQAREHLMAEAHRQQIESNRRTSSGTP